MRKSFSFLVAAFVVGVVSVAVLAQTHSNVTEKKSSDEITFNTDTLVGSQLLKAGRYLIQCDRTTITFSRMTTDVGQGRFTSATKMLEVPCLGKELPAKAERTQLSLPQNKDGVTVLEKLVLRGSNVEHVF